MKYRDKNELCLANFRLANSISHFLYFGLCRANFRLASTNFHVLLFGPVYLNCVFL